VYLQFSFEVTFCQHKALAQELAERHATADLSDIHLLVKVGQVGTIKKFSPEEACNDEIG
jgi:hypothetical protein